MGCEDHAAGSVCDSVIGVCSDVVKELFDGGSSVFGGGGLLGTKVILWVSNGVETATVAEMTESIRGVLLDESVNGAQDWSYDGQTSSAEKEGLNNG